MNVLITFFIENRFQVDIGVYLATIYNIYNDTIRVNSI